MTVPKKVRDDRELHILGDAWRDVLAVDRGTISDLFSQTDPDALTRLHRHTDPSLSFDVLVGDDHVQLWLGDRLLAQKERATDG